MARVRSREVPLVGRGDEIALLDRLLRAHFPAAAVVEITGESGIGKSRLLAELGERATRLGRLPLSGRAGQFERDVPFAAFADALDDHVAAHRLQRLLPADLAPELGAVLPSLGRPPDRSPALPSERYRAHRALRILLERIAARHPLVLLLDDLHWSDAASQEVLAHLLRHPPRGRVLMALAYRPAQAPARLSAALAAGPAGSVHERIALGPLAAPDADRLLGGGLAPALRESLYRESGGNPFYLEQLHRARRQPSRRGTAATGPRHGVPPAIAAALAQEIHALAPAARRLLTGAAVSGDPFAPWLAAAAAGMTEDEALAAIDDLAAADMVRATGAPHEIRFRHPIVHAAVYEAAPAGWRIGAHRRAAAALTDRGAPVVARARHVERSAPVGDAAAIEVLAQAGHSAAALAPAAAAHWFAAALRLLDGPEPERRLALLLPRASALVAAGLLEEGRRALLDALSSIPPGSGDDRVSLVAACAAVEHLLGRHREARERLIAELQAQTAHDGRGNAALLIELAADALYASDFEAMLSFSQAALDRARERGDGGRAATAGGLVAFATYCLGGDPGKALDEAAAALDALDDAGLALHLEATFYVGHFEYWLGRCGDALRHLERGIAAGRRTGRGDLQVPMLLGCVLALVGLGRLSHAREAAAAALDAARVAGNEHAVAWALWSASWAATHAGDVRAALQAGEESVRVSDHVDESIISAGTVWALAAARLEAGDAGGCAHLLDRRLSGPALNRVAPGVRCLCHELTVRASLQRGDIKTARSEVERADAVAASHHLPRLASVHVHRARAALLLAAGEGRAAADAAGRAAVDAEAARAPVEAARSRVLMGRALAADGDVEGAVSRLSAALTALEHCGARRYADEAARELRRLGGRVDRAAARGRGMGALSAREREIAELVSDGHTNREIAGILFIGEKTVETHLSHVFEKLGVRSRAGVAAAIVRAAAPVE